MRRKIVTVIHNPSAGDAGTERRQLIKALRASGYAPRYQSTKSAAFPSALQEPGDLVLVAGGDGTVRAVALELMGMDVPLALLPTGTANNIATSLGIADDLDGCIARLRAGHVGCMDLGRADGPFDDMYFLEGAGFGVVPELVRVMDRYAAQHPDDEDRAGELRHARSVLQRITTLLPSFDCTIRTRGEPLHLRPVLLEVMNVQRIGPALPVAPDADPCDGVFDVVWVEDAGREHLREAVRQWCAGSLHTGFACGRVRASELTIACDAPLAHVDDRVWRAKKRHRTGYEVRFTCEASAVRLL